MLDYESPNQFKFLIEEAEEVLRKAHALSYLKGTEGWQIVLAAFNDIEDQALEQLAEQIPGNEKDILAAHAVWYSVKNAYANVRKAIDAAISRGQEASDFLATKNSDPHWP